MLFEDIRTTELEGRGLIIIDVDSEGNSEDKLKVGVGSIMNDDAKSGNIIAELLSG